MGATMHIPRIMRHVNRVVTNPVMNTVAWLVPPLAIVHHVGRTSGRRYRTPVIAFPGARGFVVPMTYGRDVDWARNLVAAGGGEVEQRGRRVRATNPRVVSFPDVEADIPWAMRPVLRMADFPGYLRLDG